MSPLYVPAPPRAIQIVSTLKPGVWSMSTPIPGTGVATVGNARACGAYFNRAAMIDRLAWEVTGAGEAGATFRPGVWADTGDLMPGLNLFDGGMFPADVVAVREIAPNARLVLVPASSGYVDTPNAAPIQLTGDIDVRLKATTPDWHPSKSLADKGGGASWYWYMNGSGGMSFGVTIGAVNSWSNLSVDQNFPPGSTQFLRVNRVAATGIATFLRSLDGGMTWATLGAGNAAGTGALDVAASALSIGRSAGGVPYFDGSVSFFELRNGIDGPVVASFDAQRALPTAAGTPTTYTAPTGEVWTTHGGATWLYGLAVGAGVNWFGGVPQNCPTTPPTMRMGSQGHPGGSTGPVTDVQQPFPGYIQGGLTGAFPVSWQATPARAGIIPRMAWRIAA